MPKDLPYDLPGSCDAEIESRFDCNVCDFGAYAPLPAGSGKFGGSGCFTGKSQGLLTNKCKEVLKNFVDWSNFNY